MATLTQGTRVTQVKNLSWLLRNWKCINGFIVREHSSKVLDVPGEQYDAYLVAYGERVNGFTCRKETVLYETDFADKGVLAKFLDRLTFQNLHVSWFGTPLLIGTEEYRKVTGLKSGELRSSPDFNPVTFLYSSVPINNGVPNQDTCKFWNVSLSKNLARTPLSAKSVSYRTVSLRHVKPFTLSP